VLEDLHRAVANVRNHFETLKGRTPSDAFPQYFILDTAYDIFATSGITLTSTHVGPTPGEENNWAKFSCYTNVPEGDNFGKAGTESVNFRFLWQNPYDSYTLADLLALMVYNGYCIVTSNGGIIGEGFSNAYIDVELVIYELWNNPPTSPMTQPDQSRNALTLSCDSIGLFQSGSANRQYLAGDFPVYYTQLLMPPKGTAVFDMVCNLHWWIYNGDAFYEFSVGAEQVFSPALFITLNPS
jgi:hypothetical protein